MQFSQFLSVLNHFSSQSLRFLSVFNHFYAHFQQFPGTSYAKWRRFPLQQVKRRPKQQLHGHSPRHRGLEEVQWGPP
jgi:hypothetical protein